MPQIQIIGLSFILGMFLVVSGNQLGIFAPLYIWSIFDCLRNEKRAKILWLTLLAIMLFYPIGCLFYIYRLRTRQKLPSWKPAQNAQATKETIQSDTSAQEVIPSETLEIGNETPNDLCLIRDHKVEKQKDIDHHFKRGNLNMNKSQILILWLGILVIVALLLFPPWQFVLNENNLHLHLVSAGPYRLVFLGAPSVPVTSTSQLHRITTTNTIKWVVDEYYNNYAVSSWKVEIDKLRLLIPISIVIIVTIGLLVTFNKKERKPNNPMQTTSQ